jgi:hypothetical protein
LNDEHIEFQLYFSCVLYRRLQIEMAAEKDDIFFLGGRNYSFVGEISSIFSLNLTDSLR